MKLLFIIFAVHFVRLVISLPPHDANRTALFALIVKLSKDREDFKDELHRYILNGMSSEKDPSIVLIIVSYIESIKEAQKNSPTASEDNGTKHSK